MKQVAKFEKVSYKQFEKDCKNTFDMDTNDARDRREIEGMYSDIPLPLRATKGSAGYDFVTPVSFVLEPGAEILIPTGIRCKIEEGWVLKIYPRSSLGFKYRLQLNNTVGIIDRDYYYSDNEGHIFFKMTNNGKFQVSISNGTKIAQGVFVEYGITEDDCADDTRNGGFGSTDKENR